MSEYKALNNIAYEHLRGMIYNCEFEFGKIYSETKLAAQISISRTPMRDALNKLAHERYIDILPNRGFSLHTPSQADINEAYHIRLMIESYCADIVSTDYPTDHAIKTITRMEEALQQQHRLLENDEAYNISQFWLDDLAFHKALLEHLNILSLIQQYESVMYIFMPHHLIRDPSIHEKDSSVFERHRSTLIEHNNIIQALKSKDRNNIRSAVYTHIDSSVKALILRMKQDQKTIDSSIKGV